jgi:hypothetical protein
LAEVPARAIIKEHVQPFVILECKVQLDDEWVVHYG